MTQTEKEDQGSVGGSRKDTRRKAILALAICAILWSTSGFVLKSVTVLDSMRVSGYRCLVAAVFLIFVQGKPVIQKKPWFFIACLAYALAAFLIVQANAMTTAANAIILQYIAPVFVCIFSAIFFHQKIRRCDFAVVVAVIFGLAFFFLDSLSADQSYLMGNLIAIAAGIVMALQAVSVCQINNVSATRSVVIIGCLINFLVCLPFMGRDVAPISDYLWVLFLGVFQLGISYALYTWAVNWLSPLEVILIPAIEPLANPILTLLIRGEELTIHTVLGGVTVVGAILTWSLWKERKQGNEMEINEK